MRDKKNFFVRNLKYIVPILFFVLLIGGGIVFLSMRDNSTTSGGTITAMCSDYSCNTVCHVNGFTYGGSCDSSVHCNCIGVSGVNNDYIMYSCTGNNDSINIRCYKEIFTTMNDSEIIKYGLLDYYSIPISLWHDMGDRLQINSYCPIVDFKDKIIPNRREDFFVKEFTLQCSGK